MNVTPDQGEYISQWLGSSYLNKVGRSSGQEGKGMTIYVGKYIEAVKLAVELSAKFPIPPPIGDVLVDDKEIHKNIWGRFDINDSQWHQYGARGIPLTKIQIAQLFGIKGETRKKMIEAFIANNHLVLLRKYGEYYQP